MSALSVRVVHVFGAYCSLGGVENVLKHHHANDAAQDLLSDFVIFFEAESEPIDRVHFMGIQSDSMIGRVRRRFRCAIQEIQPQVAVYHNPWGMSYLADLDQCDRRILVLHGPSPNFEETLHRRRRWLDGLLCISTYDQSTVRRVMPDLDPGRIELFSCPISIPEGMGGRDSRPKGALTLGFCGRLQFEQKRVERLPELCRSLDKSDLAYRLEFLGDGSERAWLEKELPDRGKFIFHGRKSGIDYWRILRQWDAILFSSDYEGTPIALLEAMGCGVIPIYPQINSGGDAYAKAVHRDLLYPAYDFEHVARSLKWFAGLSAPEVEALRQRCRESVRPHLGGEYIRRFSTFVRKIRTWPRVSRNPHTLGFRLIQFLPLSALAWMSAIRRAVGRTGPKADR